MHRLTRQGTFCGLLARDSNSRGKAMQALYQATCTARTRPTRPCGILASGQRQSSLWVQSPDLPPHFSPLALLSSRTRRRVHGGMRGRPRRDRRLTTLIPIMAFYLFTGRPSEANSSSARC